jgi:putative hydrolase of HD superfamily
MKVKETVDFLFEVDRLEAYPRMGYLMRGVPRPESVAAHVFGAVWWAMLLADAIPDADADRTMRLALLHDLGEVRMTDIPYRGGLHFPAGVKEAAERSVADALLAKLGDKGQTYVELFREYQEGTSLEARIVHVADKLQMIAKVARYEQAGQRGLDDFWNTPENFRDHGLPLAAELFAELISRRKS